jgi:PAS domain-containing protein
MPSSDSKKNVESLPYALALIRATLEATVDAILATDGEGRITSWNTKFVTMWGVPPGASCSARRSKSQRIHRSTIEGFRALSGSYRGN